MKGLFKGNLNLELLLWFRLIRTTIVVTSTQRVKIKHRGIICNCVIIEMYIAGCGVCVSEELTLILLEISIVVCRAGCGARIWICSWVKSKVWEMVSVENDEFVKNSNSSAHWNEFWSIKIKYLKLSIKSCGFY